MNLVSSSAMESEARSRSIIGAAVRDNLEALGQALALLSALDAERYARRVPECFNSATGGHLRHVIEHYTGFLGGVEAGLVDYEARARDARIENDPIYAVGCIAAIREDLSRLGERGRNRRVRVRSETAGAADPNEGELWADSCVLRELEYLLSHTIHHFALIGVICGCVGHPLPKNFGMAPSTLRYLRAQAAAGAAA